MGLLNYKITTYFNTTLGALPSTLVSSRITFNTSPLGEHNVLFVVRDRRKAQICPA
jgi:hypothetical protein